MLVLLGLLGCDEPTATASSLDEAPTSASASASAAPAPPPGTTCGDLDTIEGDFIPQGELLLADRDTCVAPLHAFAGAEGSVVQVTLTAWGGLLPATVTITDLLGEPLAQITASSGDYAAVTLDRSGEFLATVAPTDPDEPANSYALSVDCAAGCGRAYTRYPVVLVHGMGGTDAYLDLIDYFYGVAPALEDAGYAVHTPTVEPFDVAEARAEDWEGALEDLQAEGAGRRFNLIGHSQGGLDARYLAGVLDAEGRVASIITVGTPHRGTPVADVVTGVLDAAWVVGFTVDLLVDSIAPLFGSSSDQDIVAQIEQLSTRGMDDFNARVPDRSDVYYASWAGQTCGALDHGCVRATGGEWVDPLLSVSHLLLYALVGDSDGMVPVSSAQWGDHRGQIPADHIDQVGHLLGTTADSFDHVDFYLSEVDRLAAAGL